MPQYKNGMWDDPWDHGWFKQVAAFDHATLMQLWDNAVNGKSVGTMYGQRIMLKQQRKER